MTSNGTAATKRDIPATLRPECVVAIIDSREQLPLNLEPLQTVVGTLQTADYQLEALPSLVCVERKSESDLLQSVGSQRKRFEAEIERMRAFETAVIVVESSWARMEAGGWRSHVTPSQAIGSLLSWMAQGVNVAMLDSHARCGRFVSRLLFQVARKRFRELRSLIE